jgi:transposase
MLSPEEDVEAQALKKQGLTISAIARHLDRDRKTIRAYVNGERQPGVRAAAGPDPFDDVADYVSQRLADDPHVLATALFD